VAGFPSLCAARVAMAKQLGARGCPRDFRAELPPLLRCRAGSAGAITTLISLRLQAVFCRPNESAYGVDQSANRLTIYFYLRGFAQDARNVVAPRALFNVHVILHLRYVASLSRRRRTRRSPSPSPRGGEDFHLLFSLSLSLSIYLFPFSFTLLFPVFSQRRAVTSAERGAEKIRRVNFFPRLSWRKRN